MVPRPGVRAAGAQDSVLEGEDPSDADLVLRAAASLRRRSAAHRDCDGAISEKDFSAACNLVCDFDGVSDHVQRWMRAAVKVEKPNLKGAARGLARRASLSSAGAAG